MRKHFRFPRYFFPLKAGLIVTAFFILFNSSCNKKSGSKNIQDETVTKKEGTNKNQAAAKGGVTTNSVPAGCNDLPNPCDDPACRPYYNNCDEEPFSLTEEQSLQVVQSSGFQNLIQKQNQFLDTIAKAVTQGTSLNTIRNAALEAIQNNNNQPIYSLLFSSSQSGELF